MKTKRVEPGDILKDIHLKLIERPQHIDDEFYPVYFHKIIGAKSENDLNEQLNELYRLDKSLKKKEDYLFFLDSIPVYFDNSVINLKLTAKNTDQIILQIILSGLLFETTKKNMKITIAQAFKETVNMYYSNNLTASRNNIKSFALKLLTWSRKNIPKLFPKGYIYDAPKVLYYGDIKVTETYLLLYFSKLGCDVIYVSLDKENDEKFRQIESYVSSTYYKYSKKEIPFPESEKLVRKSTVAYKASKEIEEVIYSADVGVFKPYQLEKLNIVPVTLKTTYEELQILWAEPSIFRPEFKVENETVYIPNLFAKINGTSENLKEYMDCFNIMANTKDTLYINKIPFTKSKFTKKELSSFAYWFNRDKTLNAETIRSSKEYKFSHLKESLQDLFLVKIQELINLDIFKRTVDFEFMIKVASTIISIDDKILKLVENFDFSSDIPKLIILDNDKEIFSEEDAIIMAFLNLMGADIVIFTPTNYANIENRIKDDYFNIHQLQNARMDIDTEDFNKPTVHKNIAGKLFDLFKL